MSDNNYGKTESHLDKILVIGIYIVLIIFDILAIFLLKGHFAFSIILTLITSSALFALGIKFKEDVKGYKSLFGIDKVAAILFLIATFFDAFAIGLIPFRTDIFPPTDKAYYDFSEINVEEIDVFFSQENNQVEFEGKLKESLLHVQKVTVHSAEYLDVLNGYSDVAPTAEKAEEMMLDIIKSNDIDVVDEMTRESIRLSVNSSRQSMDKVEHTVSNRNSLFENALSMANYRFTREFREDYCFAACYVWGRLYTSVGTGSFCIDDVDNIIRVYQDMLDSDGFPNKKDSINLVIETLNLLKSDDVFIQALTEYSHHLQ